MSIDIPDQVHGQDEETCDLGPTLQCLRPLELSLEAFVRPLTTVLREVGGIEENRGNGWGGRGQGRGRAGQCRSGMTSLTLGSYYEIAVLG